MKINAHYHRIIVAVLGLGLVFWCGRLSLQYELNAAAPPLRQVGEVNAKIPMVTITDIEDGKLMGTVNDLDIRIKSGTEVAVPDARKRFELNIGHLGFEAQTNPVLKVPSEAQFVASKNGKYFYTLDEPTAKRLSPATRVFFTSEEEAMAAGYQKRTK